MSSSDGVPGPVKPSPLGKVSVDQDAFAEGKWAAHHDEWVDAPPAPCRVRETTSTWSWLDWLACFIPCVGWLRNYKVGWLPHDLVAGFSVGAMVVPQGMSYANTAGLPSVYGLYGAFLPCMVYALIGSSKQLAVGPVAVTSLLISTRLEKIITCHQTITNYNNAIAGSTTQDEYECMQKYTHAAVQIAFLVACLYTAIGVFRMGWLMKLLGHPVIGGFTSAAAITIALGQGKYIVGYQISPTDGSTAINAYLVQYFDRIKNLKWQEFIMGTTLMGVMVFFKEAQRLWKPLRHIRSFGPLACVIIGLAAQSIADLGSLGIKLVGTIPKGLPPWTGGWWTPMDSPSFGELFPVAIIVMFVDLLESTSIARALARKNGYELEYNREITGLGLANFAGAMSNCYTTTGSFSRSAVNNNSGAKTPLAQFVCSWVVGFVLIFLTKLFENLPYNVLAAIIIVSVCTLVEHEQAIYLWKVNKLDLLCWLAAFFGVLFYSVEVGLAIAVGLALILTLRQAAFPHTTQLGQIPNTIFHRSLEQFPNGQRIPGVLFFRADAPLFYGNVVSVQDAMEELTKEHAAWSSNYGVDRTYVIVWDLAPVQFADSMGIHLLEDTILYCRKRDISLVLANPSQQLAEDWHPVNLPELLGVDNLYIDVHHASLYARALMAKRGFQVQPVGNSGLGGSKANLGEQTVRPQAHENDPARYQQQGGAGASSSNVAIHISQSAQQPFNVSMSGNAARQ